MQNFFHKYFLLFGPRLALIPIILIFGVIFTLERAGKARAQENFFKQNFNSEGLYVVTGSLEGVNFGEKIEPTGVNTIRSEETEYEPKLISVKVESVKAPTPTPTSIPTPAISSNDDDIWIQLAQCESHNNWSINTGNGYYGGLQFSQSAWNSVGGSGLPSDASREEQIERGKLLQSVRGWGAWGLCAKKLNLI